MRALLLCLIACGDDPRIASDGSTTAPNALEGDVDHTHPAVGLVVIHTATAVAVCTGTLIAPDLVLTAAHCATDPVDGFYMGIGHAVADATDPSLLFGRDYYEVDGQAADPDWTGDCASQAADLAVLHLRESVLGVLPMRLSDAPALVGDYCTAIGYGKHTLGTLGQRREGTQRVTNVTDGRVVTDAITLSIDHGDSGGPLVCGDKVFGVASCANNDLGRGLFSRVDTKLDRIWDAGERLR